ncbi:tetratricopeptide repeat protein [Saccharothrix sp. Mg75]|uniref:tetratricopeptide repeat protein n=1 Tax=Saccharothrix sp. Mg75 TaxID=3445357 RepID=UPI003EE957CE
MAERGVPGRIGLADVARLEAEVHQLRDLDYRFGGGVCRDAALVRAANNDQLLEAHCTALVRTQLLASLGDLHNLAAWMCFDTGLTRAARLHWRVALEFARDAGHQDLAANVHYRLGRVHLHLGEHREALGRFALGLATGCSPHAASVLHVNMAWAHAGLGDRPAALADLHQAHDRFARSGPAAPPGWARFFDDVDLSAMTGMVHTELARTVDLAHTGTAVPALTNAVFGYSEGMVRSRVFCLIALSTNHLLDGDADQAARVGEQALASAPTVHSARLSDRLAELRALADRHPKDTSARELASRIDAFTAAV